MARPRLELVPLEEDTPDRRTMRKWMEKQGHTVTSAAEELGCSDSHLSAWILHRTEASPGNWEKWAEVIGCSTRTFHDGRFAPKPKGAMA